MLSTIKTWVTAALLTVGTTAMAAEFTAGKEYKILDEPVAVMQDGKIHVEEAFWYGCPHCFHLETELRPWKASLPSDVEFEGVPAMFGRAWVAHAQMYYTMDVLGVLDQLNTAVFEAIHLKKLQLLSQEEQREFVTSQTDVTAEDFDKAYESFTVKSRMSRGDKRVRAFEISGVPAVIVNGRYVTSPSMAGSGENMIKVLNFLIAEERK